MKTDTFFKQFYIFHNMVFLIYMRKILLPLLFVCLSITASASIIDDDSYGLYIKSFPFNDSQKTSLVLENNDYFKINKDFSISFDINVRPENVFGIIGRIISDKGDNIDLVFTVGDDDKRYPMLVVNESVHMIPYEVTFNKWANVKIDLLKDKNAINIVYDTIEVTFPYKKHFDRAKISFGLCPFQGFSLYDIASINIRNIKIFDQQKLIRKWTLEHHRENLSVDSIKQIPAICENAKWLIDTHSTWEKIYHNEGNDYYLISYNQKENLFYFTSPQHPRIIKFDPETREVSNINIRENTRSTNAPNQLICDTLRDELFTYNLDEGRISRLSKELIWTNNSPATLENGYWNNSACYQPAKNTIISFGGYGAYKFCNKLIRFNTITQERRTSILQKIPPRSFTSTTIVGNTLYIFGGRGNSAGRQELTIHHYYDLYAVDLITEQVNKLWEIEQMDTDFLPSENMVYDASKDCFYVFTTKGGGTLLKIQKEYPNIQDVSFPVDRNLTSHYLYINLYFSTKANRFYATISETQIDKSVQFTLYSLPYPPTVIATNKNIAREQESSSLLFSNYSVIIIATITILLLCIGIYSVRRKKTKGHNTTNSQTDKSKHSENKEMLQAIDLDLPDAETYSSPFSFLGGFKMLDKANNDIADQFSPMLRDLFIILILHKEDTERGIADKRLIQFLWADKSDKAAKNNRNVYLSRLRTLLDSVGTIDIVNNVGYWTIVLQDSLECDYLECMKLLKNIDLSNSSDKEGVNKLLQILNKGSLLPNTEEEWLDPFKSNFSNLVIDFLTELVYSNQYMLSDNLKLKIADMLFTHDYINEDALYIKCSVLSNSGKKGIAKAVYDNFNKEYQILLGTDYRLTFNQVLDKKKA